MEINNNNITDFQPSNQLTELIQSLEQATLMAKQLPTTFDTDHHRLIFTSLSSAQLSLSSFLSLHHNFADNSVSSAVDEPMMTVDDDEEQNSKDLSMVKVEEKMRESLCIQNKRLKRPISPSSAVAVERRRLEDRVLADFDSPATRLRNLDLVFQFHA